MHGNLKRSIFDGGHGFVIALAIIITVGVVIGLVAVSIALFGFEWRKYFGRSDKRDDLEVNTKMLDSEISLDQRHPTSTHDIYAPNTS